MEFDAFVMTDDDWTEFDPALISYFDAHDDRRVVATVLPRVVEVLKFALRNGAAGQLEPRDELSIDAAIKLVFAAKLMPKVLLPLFEGIAEIGDLFRRDQQMSFADGRAVTALSRHRTTVDDLLRTKGCDGIGETDPRKAFAAYCIMAVEMTVTMTKLLRGDQT